MGNSSAHRNLKRRRKKCDEEEPNSGGGLMDYFDERDYLLEERLSINFEDSEICNFYKGKNVLLTGASGFIGTILLEKLLRCTEINKIFVFFRQKKGQSIEDRIKNYLKDDAFDNLRSQSENFTEKIVFIPADIQSEGLALSPEHREFLIRETQVVFHVAATVKFDEHLRIAYETNVRGTNLLLEMAEEMKNLCSFVYVSTAYSNCDYKTIEEKFYDPIYTHTEFQQLIEFCSDEELTILNDKLIKPMPNSYTLTKRTAEYSVRLRMDRLPIGIVRPSIVMPNLEEPRPMWVKGMTGLTAMYAAVGLGVMRTVYQSTENLIDIVPGDFVGNGILAVGWSLGTSKEPLENFGTPISPVCKKISSMDDNNNYMTPKIEEQLPNGGGNLLTQNGKRPLEKPSVTGQTSQHIYHIVSCKDNPITLGHSSNLTIHHNNNSEEGCDKMLWVIHHNPTNNKWLYFFYFYLFNILPTILFFEYLEKLSGKPAQLMKLYRRAFFLNNAIEAFSINEWHFTNSNSRALLQRLNPQDKKLFNFSVKNVSWPDYHLNLSRTLVKYCLGSVISKESYNSRVKYMVWADRFVLTLLKFSFFFGIYYLIKFVFVRNFS